MFINMNFNMNDMFEAHNVIFEIYIEDKLTNRQTMQAPRQILEMEFLKLAKQISQDSRPIKVKMIVPETKWSKFENKQFTLNNEVAFLNNAMVSWEESRGNES